MAGVAMTRICSDHARCIRVWYIRNYKRMGFRFHTQAAEIIYRDWMLVGMEYPLGKSQIRKYLVGMPVCK